jgi:hypothetical protein
LVLKFREFKKFKILKNNSFISVSILLRRIEVELNDILNQSSVNTIEDKSVFYHLFEILQQYDISYSNMLHLDRYNDACEIMLTRSVQIWKRFARDAKNVNDQKQYLSRALNILEQLTEILAERWNLIRTVTPQNDVRISYSC